MEPVKGTRKPMVKRITVDAKMGEDLIRLEVCTLKEDARVFRDSPSVWEDPQERIVTPRNYWKLMGLTVEQRQVFPWGSLEEGHVYLSGNVELSEIGGKNPYMVNPDVHDIIPIHEWTKYDYEELYFEALEGREIDDREYPSL